MNVSTKFEINPMSSLSGNAHKPQKLDWRTDGWISPFLCPPPTPLVGTIKTIPLTDTVQSRNYPDNKVHGANMGPTWVLSAPDGPHVGPMNLAMRVCTHFTLFYDLTPKPKQSTRKPSTHYMTYIVVETIIIQVTMMPRHRNSFQIIGPLWGESTSQ